MLRIGPHLSISKGLPAALDQAEALGANALQFFTRNPRGSAARDIPTTEVEAWRERRRQQDISPAVAHIPYTVNLASPRERPYTFAITVLAEDWLKCHRLGAEFLVTHPGSYVEGTREEGLARIIAAVNASITVITERVPAAGTSTADERHPLILLETMSGQGTEIGGRFEELALILQGVTAPGLLGVCLDTSHLFAAGWDMRTRDGLDACLERLDTCVGLEQVRAVHLNDSCFDLGSHKDRHARWGQGRLGIDGLRNILTHPRLRALPFLLETPAAQPSDWAEEIRLAKNLSG